MTFFLQNLFDPEKRPASFRAVSRHLSGLRENFSRNSGKGAKDSTVKGLPFAPFYPLLAYAHTLSAYPGQKIPLSCRWKIIKALTVSAKQSPQEFSFFRGLSEPLDPAFPHLHIAGQQRPRTVPGLLSDPAEHQRRAHSTRQDDTERAGNPVLPRLHTIWPPCTQSLATPPPLSYICPRLH